MTDSFALDIDGWFEHAELPGWRMKVALFDAGHRTGVAITDGQRRYAVSVPSSASDPIADAMPMLKKWAGAE